MFQAVVHDFSWDLTLLNFWVPIKPKWGPNCADDVGAQGTGWGVVRGRAGARRVRVHACMLACLHACMRACVRARVRAREPPPQRTETSSAGVAFVLTRWLG